MHGDPASQTITDHSYVREPALGSIRVPRALPTRGDTQFLRTYDAVAALPLALR